MFFVWGEKQAKKTGDSFACFPGCVRSKRKELKNYTCFGDKCKNKRKLGGEELNNDVFNELKTEYDNIHTLCRRLQTSIDAAPEGSLRVNGTKGRKPIFYQYIPEEKEKSINGFYLTNDNIEVAKQLAQKGYDRKMLEWAERAEFRLRGLINCYEHNQPEIIYNSLSDIKREMVVPYYVSDEVFLEKWLGKWHCDRNTYEKKDFILSDRGEQVRSKSEKIIADKLYAEGIPYVYEPELILDDGERVFPDFATLNVRTRKEYLFEHFGRMDEIAYCRKNIRKIEDYALSGYLLGDGLLATFETNGNTFDTRYLDALVKRYLK